jgi:DNA primase
MMPSRFDIDGDVSLELMARARSVSARVVIERVTGLRGRGPHLCPLPDHDHDKKSAPAFISYPGTRGWFCFSCGRGGGAVEFVMMYKGWTRARAVEALAKSAGPTAGFEVALSDLEEAKTQMRAVKELGALDYYKLHAEMRMYRDAFHRDEGARASGLANKWQISRTYLEVAWGVGWNESEQRYWLPVYDQSGRLVDVRRRSEHTAPKVKSLPGFGVGGHLFGANLLQHDARDLPVVVVGGEKDVIVASYHIRLRFVSGTLGEGKWVHATMGEPLRGRHVVIFYDDDEAGRKGSKIVARSLRGVASTVSVVSWPVLTYGMKDISDIILAGKVEGAKDMIKRARVVYRDPLLEMMEVPRG